MYVGLISLSDFQSNKNWSSWPGSAHQMQKKCCIQMEKLSKTLFDGSRWRKLTNSEPGKTDVGPKLQRNCLAWWDGPWNQVLGDSRQPPPDNPIHDIHWATDLTTASRTQKKEVSCHFTYSCKRWVLSVFIYNAFNFRNILCGCSLVFHSTVRI